MALGYDARMKDALLRQQVAITRLKLHGDALKHAMTAEVEQVAKDLSTKPEAFITSHPWKCAGGAFAAGFAMVPLAKLMFGGTPSQKVTVEVVNRQASQPVHAAKPVAPHTNGAQHHEKPSPWKAILDAAMQGLQSVGTAAAAKVAHDFQRRVGHTDSNGNGNGNGHGGHSASADSEAFEQPGVAGGHFDEQPSTEQQGVDKKW